MRKLTFAMMTICGFVAAQLTQAQTVTVILDVSTPNAFDILLEASAGDNNGVVSYGLDVTGSFLTLDHNSPNTSFAQDGGAVGGAAGFTFLRSADNSALVGASQDTIAPTPHLIEGFGQVDSSFVNEGLTALAPAEQPDWGFPLLIASGTTDSAIDPNNFLDIDSIESFVNIFDQSGGIVAADLAFRVQDGPDPNMTPNTPPVVDDLFAGETWDQETQAFNGTPASYQLQATDTEDGDDANLGWVLDNFTGPFTAGGNPIAGAGNGNQTVSATGLFEWDPTGSTNGYYFADVTVTDSGGLTDTGILRVQVPEPSTMLLASLSLVGVFARRRNS